MEGLEVSEIQKSQILVDNLVFRIDSEYFKKKYIIEDQNRSKFKNEYLGNIAFITDGQHGYHEVDENSPIRHLTAKNAKGWFANDLGADRIAKWVDDNNKRSSLCKNDLILSTRGTVGLCAIVDSEVLPANIDQDVARIEISKEGILPAVVLTYLNSQVGQDWLERNQTGMVQQGIALWRVREIPLPVFSIPFQDKIASIINNSKSQKDQAKTTYSQAETLLLQSIGLHDFKPSSEAVNIKSFKDSFVTSERLDADFYQVKYDELLSIIKSRVPYKKIVEIKTENFRGVQPVYEQDGELDIINSKHILETTLDYGNFEKANPVNWDLQSRARIFKGDILTYTTGANIGRTQVYLIDNKALASNHVNILRLKNENPYYVGFVLNSLIGRLQTEKYSAGSAQAELYPKDLDEFVVPFVKEDIQLRIIKLVNESFDLKKQSEHLLEVAKKAVEMAIEEGEERAMEEARRASM